MAEYHELLHSLIQNWESELVEFKEASGQYHTDKIGQYFSAISNEANLRDQQYGWLIFGVSEQHSHQITGTAFKQGNPQLLEKFKQEISQFTTDGITFLDIIELTENGKRILMFKIPAAALGIPTAWHNQYYARAGDSLKIMPQFKIDQIRSKERRDWSKGLLPDISIQQLDADAIQFARKKYIETKNRPHITEEILQLTDEEFLTKLKLLLNGKVTKAAMLLLGQSQYDYAFTAAPSIMWRLWSDDSVLKDREIFQIPFITVIDKILAKIRNLTYRYMPNQHSLFVQSTQQYDNWLLRELLNNCIAHTNYQLGGRIYVDEYSDHICIKNPGNFLPQTIENVLKASYNPPYYRNPLLAEAMVNTHMIDTATSGIKKVYRIQKDKFFPMPDYDLSESQVSVTIYGKILNENYTRILFSHPDLDLETVFLLDQIQKNRPITKAALKFLRKNKLVEGRANHLYLSGQVAQTGQDKAQYIKNKGFNDNYYRDLIRSYLSEYGKAQKKDIQQLLWDKLPDSLTDKQKNSKISNLLTSMRKKNIIRRDSRNQQKAYWVLV